LRKVPTTSHFNTLWLLKQEPLSNNYGDNYGEYLRIITKITPYNSAGLHF